MKMAYHLETQTEAPPPGLDIAQEQRAMNEEIERQLRVQAWSQPPEGNPERSGGAAAIDSTTNARQSTRGSAD